MDLGEIDLMKILGGAVVGAIAAFIHHLIAGLVIAPIMWGSLFYYEGTGLAGHIVTDIIVMILVGGIIGAIGAFIGLNVKIDQRRRYESVRRGTLLYL